ncbi:S41 family peptidase [Pararhodonellum marinum]|uniref:S41 family peptidase n=1 Tax=Pararhodonellum marinum TaxID=2755358 RepID=UPI001890A6A4|nr:S41 family peptidase [Pararhodonellum marinum]
MKKYSTLLSFVLIISCQSNQENRTCTCEDDLTFSISFMSENYAGFSDKVHNENKRSYEFHNSEALKKAKKARNTSECMLVMRQWIDFFKDGHVQIHAIIDPPAQEDSLSKKQLKVGRERIDLPSKLDFDTNSIEGLYFTADSSYQVAIVANKNEFRDFVAVVRDAKSDWWDPGMVKAEFKRKNEDEFYAINYNLYHRPQIGTVKFTAKGSSDRLWWKAGSDRSAIDSHQNESAMVKKLEDDILYLKVTSFEDWNFPAIDSIFNFHKNLFEKSEKLIIDIRGNGGGSDYVYGPILDYLYTDTIKSIGVDILASEANIAAWEALFTEYPDLPEEQTLQIQALIDSMGAHQGEFASLIPDGDTVKEIKPYPKKVVVLIDGDVASSGEQFVLDAQQSSKVTLMGTNTAGVLDYANVRRKDLNCLPLGLFYATTRSRRIDMGQGVDPQGIAPDIILAIESDWMEEAVKFLNTP